MQSRIADDLFIFEMANNHMGDVEHGLYVIEQFGKICKDFPEFNFAIKMQYRQLDSFIHPEYRDRMDIKYVKRFSETRLSREDTKRLVKGIKDNGFIAICTPFDNASVPLVVEDGFDVLKIASCSFTDWPLLEAMGKTTLPVIASTAGIALEHLDSVVNFMQNRDKDFVVMHCVAEYPTPDEHLQIGQIDFLRKRYPDTRIGFSTHETPDATLPVAMAVAKGVRVFEKHIAVETEKYSVNAYSSTPEHIRKWLESARAAYKMLGVSTERMEPTEVETASLLSLRRGVFATREIKAGERIKDEDVFMAIPTQEGHVTANDWSKYCYYTASEDIHMNQPILTSNTEMNNVRDQVYSIVQKVKALLNEGNVVVPGKAALEISHHYGIDEFYNFGITMVTVVNREYCKKLIVVLPNQKHPEQYHKQKEETFHVLWGEMKLVLDGKERICKPGDVITVKPGVNHAFETTRGVVVEEISSTHFVDDSYYIDPKIAENKNRKTFLNYWMA